MSRDLTVPLRVVSDRERDSFDPSVTGGNHGPAGPVVSHRNDSAKDLTRWWKARRTDAVANQALVPEIFE
jgi:hypothetical protein